MNTAFLDSFKEVVGHEGGYTDRRSDPGNWTGGRIGKGELKGTKFGVSAASYPHLDIKNLTLADVQAIYYKDYWVEGLPRGVDFIVFDSAVQHGPGKGAKWLQIAVGAKPDGAIGPKTLAALKGKPEQDVINEFLARRMYFYMLLDHMDDEYGLGWSRRMIAVAGRAFELTRRDYGGDLKVDIPPVPPKDHSLWDHITEWFEW